MLIVDDEQHVREAIRLLGDWDRQGVKEIYEASNGEEATNLISRHKPQIIFSDMKMPKMDGIQLLEWIKDNHPTGKTIVVTGYDDYHYMRKAIHFGSADYILKPVDPEVLNQTLEHAIKAWEKEEFERKKDKDRYQLINQMKPIYRDRMFTKLLNNHGLDEMNYEETGLPESSVYQTALVKINEKTIKRFGGGRDIVYFTVLNVINEIVTAKNRGIGFRYLAHKGEIVIIFWEKTADVEQLLIGIYNTLKNVLGISCPIALGIPVDHSVYLLKSYQKAKDVLLSQNVMDKEAVRVYLEEREQDAPEINLLSHSAAIELATQAGEINAFEEVFDNITRDFRERSFLSWNQLIQFEKEYLVISHRFFTKYNIPYSLSEENEKRIDLFFDENGTFMLEDYIERRKREISLMLRVAKRHSRKRKSNILSDIEQYLQANFYRDVKLQEIADHFYLSREYISRKFKQEFNENISDYIVKIRINKAKSLLKNSQLKIYEIANMIGYQDDKYFRKVFKKVAGITPNEYRSSHM
ncbi:response regulator [Peribacillus deserti]|uniref:response regulator n=1 Tax=Peribacillus deserti TaxID=673318 RepID=UPI002152ADE9|nr:response regulator [Peribacillus deserti]